MTASSRIRELANKLVQLSLDEEGRVVEEKVREVLESLRVNPPREHKQLLRAYMVCIQREFAKGVAIIEYSGKPQHDTIEAQRKVLSQEYGRSIEVELRENPNLLVGIRLRVGDDVYEDSAVTRLRPLVRALG